MVRQVSRKEKSVLDIGSLSLSSAALVVSLLSFYFSIKSWRETNRPIVTARVSSFDGGNMGTALNILVENSGNRPAIDVRLSINPDHLKSALREDVDPVWSKSLNRIFSERGSIAVLGNGRSVSNDFGFLSGDSQSTWKGDLRLTVEISYQDLDGRKFRHSIPLLIADDKGFAGGFWG